MELLTVFRSVRLICGVADRAILGLFDYIENKGAFRQQLNTDNTLFRVFWGIFWSKVKGFKGLQPAAMRIFAEKKLFGRENQEKCCLNMFKTTDLSDF